MPKIDLAQSLTIFVGNLPTFIAVILAWMHSNGRFSDINSRFSDLRSDVNRQIQETRAILSEKIDRTNDRIDHTRDLLRAEFLRVEEVTDARLKHLEERH